MPPSQSTIEPDVDAQIASLNARVDELSRELLGLTHQVQDLTAAIALRDSDDPRRTNVDLSERIVTLAAQCNAIAQSIRKKHAASSRLSIPRNGDGHDANNPAIVEEGGNVNDPAVSKEGDDANNPIVVEDSSDEAGDEGFEEECGECVMKDAF